MNLLDDGEQGLLLIFICNENICMLIACHDRELIDLPKMHTVHLSSADARVGTA
jgi:hypothetical protein